MVKQYQAEGEAAVNDLQKIETLFWGMTLLLLLLEAALIFHPFVKHVRRIITKLQQATEALELHQEQLEDVVKQRTAELKIKNDAFIESEEKFRLISTAAKDGIAIMGEKEQLIYWNPAAEKIFGYEDYEVIGKNLHKLLAPARYHDVAHKGCQHFRRYGVGPIIGKTLELTARHKNGAEFPIELSISAFKFHNNFHALGIMRDITERKKMEAQVHQLAFYDPLTNLPNRRLLHDRLAQAINNSKRSEYYAALMMLDLDNFKPINDAHGHAAGDLLLIEVAKRLKSGIREIDTVARFGGDEFVLLLNKLAIEKTESTLQARIIAEKIRDALSAPYRLIIQNSQENTESVIEHYCSASIGVVVFINHEASQDNILKWADDAMYQAKENGRNLIRFHDLTA